jgi:glutathionylspermidine synthase
VPNFGGNHAVVGSWMVNGYACGIGVREDATPVTGNLSRFVPHVFSG